MGDHRIAAAALPVPARRPSKQQDHHHTSKRKDRRRTAANPAATESRARGLPTQASPARGDVSNDWTFVQRQEDGAASIPTTSDTTSIQGVGPELNASNIQLHDELNKTISWSSGDRMACRRRCRQCLEGSDDEHRNVGHHTYYDNMHGDGSALHMWAPVPYDTDVAYMGTWTSDVDVGVYNDDIYAGLTQDR
ncbi:hypothetical protein JDV02_001460 [Purpureocillium takamizusanense]|uniref:Uncharacterized protein n=1 Tax=Purpureocillium takamizusanense TaxID=2060973 RepID=A0A9Q8Q985_9HYPO|nr:uncharacterized protein JDV02_001460 [Purpureocillium takamizusanense]UNI14878.1 hypothetical protein JDV02_001460 [Purpureocillium takamizusanense]